MKLISLILLSILMNKGCGSAQQSDLDNTILEYSTVTRGSSMTITIHKQNMDIERNSRGSKTSYSQKISDADWQQLITAFSKVKPDDLPNLTAPTQKRLYDGAPTANLKITYQGKVSATNGFDHGEPPAEIRPLVEKILSLIKKEE